MAKPSLRKTRDEVLENAEVRIIHAHVDDWHYCNSSAPFKYILRDYPDKLETFNIQAAITAPKSIKYRQRNCEFDGGSAGDYVLVDKSGGRMSLPFVIFNRLFS